MTQSSLEKSFLERIRHHIISLPYDMKVLFEVLSDENLTFEARQLAASAVIHCISPSDPFSDPTGMLGFVDDTILLRLTLNRLQKTAGEDFSDYPERFPEQFDALTEDLDLFRSFLGDMMGWFEKRLERIIKRAKYKGKDAANYVTNDDAREFLYDEGLTFTADYELDDEAAVRLQSTKPLLEAFNQRITTEAQRIG